MLLTYYPTGGDPFGITTHEVAEFQPTDYKSLIIRVARGLFFPSSVVRTKSSLPPSSDKPCNSFPTIRKLCDNGLLLSVTCTRHPLQQVSEERTFIPHHGRTIQAAPEVCLFPHAFSLRPCYSLLAGYKFKPCMFLVFHSGQSNIVH